MATVEANIPNKTRTTKKTSKDEILESNSDVLKEIDAEQIRLSSEEDLESLLKLAEQLKEKIEKPLNRIKLLRLIQAAYIFFILPLFIGYSFYPRGLYSTNIIVDPSVITLIVIILTVVVTEFGIRMLKNRVLPDKLALKEVLQLLREVHGTIAEREDWSILKRAEFRIRLSRFDLSEKKASIFSFFS